MECEAWFTNDFLKAIRERDFLNKNAKKNKSINDWQNFKLKRNHINKMKSKAKQKYYNKSL